MNYLTKWSSNSKRVLRRIPDQELAQSFKGLEDKKDLPIECATFPGIPKPIPSALFSFQAKIFLQDL